VKPRKEDWEFIVLEAISNLLVSKEGIEKVAY